RPEQTAAAEPCPLPNRIDYDLSHSREVDHQAIAGAEAREAVSSTSNGSRESDLASGPDGMLNVAHIGAARNHSRLAAKHAVPHRTRSFVGGVTTTQQVAFELPPQRRVRLLTDTRHLLVSWLRPRPYHGVMAASGLKPSMNRCNRGDRSP